MGWASGMQAGTAMARNWIDTYRSSNEAHRIKKVMEDTQQEIHAFDKDTTARIAADQAAGKSLQATVGADGVPVYHSFPAATPEQQQFVQGVVDPLPRTQSGQGLAPLSGQQPPRQLGVVGPAPTEMIDNFIERGSAGLAREPLFPQGRSQRPLPRTTNGDGLAPAAPPTADESVSYRAKPQWTYGGRTYDAPLSEEALRLEQQRRIGLEVQKYRPEEGLRIQLDAERAMRDAELHPLNVQAKKQSIESTGYTLRDQQRDEESVLRVDAWRKALASRPELAELPVEQVAAIARKEFGLTDKEINGEIEDRLNVAKGSIEVAQTEMELLTRDMPLPKLLEFQRTEVADGVHFAANTDAEGRVTLQMRDDNDPNKIIETLTFDNAAYAEQYLRGFSKDKDVALGYIEAQRKRIREAEEAAQARRESQSKIGLQSAQAAEARARAHLAEITDPNLRALSGSAHYSTRSGNKVPAGNILQGYTSDGPVTGYTKLDPETNTVILVDTQTGKPIDVPFVPNSEMDPKAIAADALKLVNQPIIGADGRPQLDRNGKVRRHNEESAHQAALNLHLAPHLGWRFTDAGLPPGKSEAFGGGNAATKTAPTTGQGLQKSTSAPTTKPAPTTGQGLQTSTSAGAGRNARQEQMAAYAEAQSKREAQRKAAADRKAAKDGKTAQADAVVRRITGGGLISAPPPTLSPEYRRQMEEDARYWGILRQ